MNRISFEKVMSLLSGSEVDDEQSIFDEDISGWQRT